MFVSYFWYFCLDFSNLTKFLRFFHFWKLLNSNWFLKLKQFRNIFLRFHNFSRTCACTHLRNLIVYFPYYFLNDPCWLGAQICDINILILRTSRFSHWRVLNNLPNWRKLIQASCNLGSLKQFASFWRGCPFSEVSKPFQNVKLDYMRGRL